MTPNVGGDATCHVGCDATSDGGGSCRLCASFMSGEWVAVRAF